MRKDIDANEALEGFRQNLTPGQAAELDAFVSEFSLVPVSAFQE